MSTSAFHLAESCSVTDVEENLPNTTSSSPSPPPSSTSSSTISPPYSPSYRRKLGAHHLLEVSELFIGRPRKSGSPRPDLSDRRSSMHTTTNNNNNNQRRKTTSGSSKLGGSEKLRDDFSHLERGITNIDETRGCLGRSNPDGDTRDCVGQRNEKETHLILEDDAYNHNEWPKKARVNSSGETIKPNLRSNMDKFSVETFLDDHPEFLSDYILRKVPQSVLEKWLFQPSYFNLGPIAKVSPHPQSSRLKRNPKRQRSRSFTPLRKHSATAFEEGGLSTPILITDSDGQHSFLRTPSSRRTSSNKLSQLQVPVPQVTVTPSQSKLDLTSIHDTIEEAELNADLLDLLLRILRGVDLDWVVEELCRGTKSILGLDNVEVFIGNGSNILNGDYHLLDQGNVFEKTKTSADRLFTGVLSSQETISRTRPDLILNGNFVTSMVCIPLNHPLEYHCFGAIRATTHGDRLFDESLFNIIATFAAFALSNNIEKSEMGLEITRSEVFLELAHTVFREHNRIEPTIKTILGNFLTMIECERCQILLTCEDNPTIFKRVYDMQRRDLNEEGQCKEGTPHEGRFPINLAITGEVALKGVKINIHNLEQDERFDCTLNDDAGLIHRTMLCMPFRDSETERVLGVISLINKENEGVFTENDERFVEAFAIFCAIAIKNANDYEAAIKATARVEVAFDTMNYQATSCIEEAKALATEQIPSSKSLCLDEFYFDYMDMTDMDTCKATLRMFIDMGLISRFHMDWTTVCRWVLTVKKNYRNDTVSYHNWYHGFNVAQTMFVMLRKTGWESRFGQLDCLGLLVACLSHDLDHRGTTNAFQAKSNNPLSTLYATSTLERHHLNQCLLLLNIPGNRILENLSENEYSAILSLLERCILATDLAIHFRKAQAIRALANDEQQLDWSNADHKSLLQSAMMTAADLAAITKPWKVHFHTSNLLAEEFWAQGDIERENFHESPQPMMDREASLAHVQLDFIDKVCQGVYEDMEKFSPTLHPMLDGCMENRKRWAKIEPGAIARARNL
ncbi:cGMP-specific 3',5'-cyclic phosphodiesterase-like [Tigriopus californicus]|nr:cGMP-specific 3',5'-cyclic phosphodiesterase-like [Tigriopus californicus]